MKLPTAFLGRYFVFFKWAYLCGVLFFAGFTVFRHSGTLAQMARQMPWWAFAASAFFLLVGKILLVINMQAALKCVNVHFSFAKAYRVYNTTQLAKYIPGTVWQFIGRGAVYAREGLSGKTSGLAIFIEVAWTVSAAILTGVILLLLTGRGMLAGLAGRQPSFYLWASGLAGLALAVVIFLGLTKKEWIRRLAENIRGQLKHHVSMLMIQLGVWMALGLGFWMLTMVFQTETRLTSVFFVIGLFAFAYSVGFFSFFAPAGIGMREGLLAYGLSAVGQLSMPTAVFLAAAGRMMYITIELVLIFFPIGIFSKKSAD